MTLALHTFPTVTEANAALQAAGARYFGGGTLVVRAVSEGDLTIDRYVRTSDARLSRIDIADCEATLGASVTMAAIARHKDLAAVAKAARAVGGPAIRNMATVGGNLFAPSPYGDFAVALLALDATVRFEDREMPIREFLATRVDAGPIVTSVRFKLPADTFRFSKVSRVRPKGVSVLSIAASIERGVDGTVISARIALGCMADRPVRAKPAEAALIGAMLTEDGIARAVAAVREGTSPITDPIASAWYRNEVLPVHFRRLLLA